jgi:hypothetical protein
VTGVYLISSFQGLGAKHYTRIHGFPAIELHLRHKPRIYVAQREAFSRKNFTRQNYSIKEEA